MRRTIYIVALLTACSVAPALAGYSEGGAFRLPQYGARAWGMGGAAQISPNTYALFVSDVVAGTTTVYTVSPGAPATLSAPVAIYQFDEVQQATVLLDNATNTWFMYYRSAGYYGLKLAPAGNPDTTPPGVPNNVTVMSLNDEQLRISWDPAVDLETGIVAYRVYRNGAFLETVKGSSYVDSGLEELTHYNYTVSAINYHGLTGLQSAPAGGTTQVDVTRPSLSTVTIGAYRSQVTLTFSEPVAEGSAETVANYMLSGGARVTGATLQADMKTVLLTTTAHANGVYHVLVSNVTDRAGGPNPILPNTNLSYLSAGLNGQAAAWTLDENSGETAHDTGNFGNNGALRYGTPAGPSWTNGRIFNGLHFDGLNDQVTISGEGSLASVTDGGHTFSAWVRPDTRPPGTNANNTNYSILVRNYTGLYYGEDQRFRADVRLANGAKVTVSSGTFAPNMWHHVTMVVDDAAKRLRLFVDGQEVGASPVQYSGALAVHSDAPYYLGASEPLTNFYEYRFDGKIDEVCIYDLALSPAGVQMLYNWQPSIPLPYAIHLPLTLR